MIHIRWILSILGMYSCALLFMYRAGISVAIVYMTRSESSTATMIIVDDDDDLDRRANRTVSYHDSDSKRIFAGNFDWNQSKQGTILASSFYLYWCTPTLIGALTDRYGGQWFAFAGVFGPAILSAIIPITTEWYREYSLIVIQILVGAFHGFTYPALFAIYSKWFLPEERCRANSFMMVGNAIGCAVMYQLAGYLCTISSIRWHLVFYVMAILHLPWLILWLWFASEYPIHNKRISQIELEHITRGICVRAKVILFRSNFDAIKINQGFMCCAFGFFLLLNKMTSYFAMVFDLNIRQNGTISALVMAAFGLTSFLSPYIIDSLVNWLQIDSLMSKKISQTLAMAGPAMCMLAVPQFLSDSNIIFGLIIGSMFLHGFFASGEWTIVSEYTRNFSGPIVGFVHSLAFLMGVVAPMMVGWILESPLTGDTIEEKWNLIFYITTSIYLIGNVVFLIFGTDQQQEWDKV
ncbi:Major Facilitator-like protein 1, partial [Sarcoptes scabiei]